MSRRTQLTTKFIFQILAQLSENFIFIYLGLTLFTETDLVFKPLFILVTVVGICAARWLAVFPLSKAINYIIRLRAKRQGREAAEELPWHYQAMLFWAGLRGAVGVALAAGLQGNEGPALRATVLVVVVLTVIIFGGTTARMLEILGIRTGVVEEIDSDDEFDIETANGGTYYKRSGTGFGHNPRPSNIGLDYVGNNGSGTPNGNAGNGSRPRTDRGYSSGNGHSPPLQTRGNPNLRKNSSISQRDRGAVPEQGTLLYHNGDSPSLSDDESDAIDLDLPPSAPRRKPSPLAMAGPPGGGLDNRTRSEPNILHDADGSNDSGDMGAITTAGTTSGGRIRDLLRGATADHTAWFRQLDEDFIKPHLLLDQHQGQGKGPPPV
jgi:sodium/hydrogen exchanger-like protein 6/7